LTFAARVHQAAQSGLPALGSAVIAVSYTLPDTATLTFNSDGSITYFKENFASGPATWYGAISAGIGASYEIRFTLNSGDAWDAGLASGTWYSLSSARAISLSATTIDKSSNVTIDIRLASSGVIQTTGSGGVSVYDIP
jgi:hypothetical protein